MTIEQGKYGLWYSKGVGFATKEQAQAHEDGCERNAELPTQAEIKKTPAAWLSWAVAALILVFVIVAITKRTSSSESKSEKMSSNADIQEIKYQRLAREQVSLHLKDPDSAQFRNQKEFCGEVNAKNSLGGYTGFKRFIAAGKDMVFIEGDPSVPLGVFQEAWSQACR